MIFVRVPIQSDKESRGIMSWIMPGAGILSKALCSLLLVLIILQYMFGTVGYRRWDSLFYTTNVTSRHTELSADLATTKRHRLFVELLFNTSNTITTTYTTSLSFDDNTTLPFANITAENASTSLRICPPVPPDLNGRVEVRKNPIPSVQVLESRFAWLKPGGSYAPNTCVSRYRVAIVVPYRARAEHLLLFIQHMHPFLRKQQLDYTIFIVEQNGDGPFNRAMLMNIGFTEALKLRPYDCFIFHDVDLLPEDDRNLYTCPEQPRHMSVAVDVFKYKLPYNTLFGGVSALTREQFTTVNGFSNSFWGWGGEDDDMSNRVKYHSYHISRYPVNIARYTMLTHQKEKANPKRFENLQQGKKKFNTDGLVSLKYALVQSRANLLYTWFLVDLRKPS